MSGLGCAIDGCESPGVIPVDPPTDPPSYVCFAHAGIVAGEPAETTTEPAAQVFNADIANNLGAELLEALSVAMTGDEAVIDGVFDMLADETNLDRSIVAAVMLALSMVATAGQVPSADVLALANTLRENAADAEWQDPTPPPHADEVLPVLAGRGSDESPEAGTDAARVCDACEGLGVVSESDDLETHESCPVCEGTGYLAGPDGPTIFDALAELDDEPFDLHDQDPELDPTDNSESEKVNGN